MAALAGSVVLAAAALPFLVDVNRYRPMFVSSVREATGRTLGLGTISFALLPAPGPAVGGESGTTCRQKKLQRSWGSSPVM